MEMSWKPLVQKLLVIITISQKHIKQLAKNSGDIKN